jgi:hypothetical protein
MKAPYKMRLASTFFAFALAIFCNLASADSIQLRNGRHLQGKYIGGSTTTIGFMTAHSVEYFQTADVLALVFDNSPESSSSGPQSNHMDGSASPAVVSPPKISPINMSPRRGRRPVPRIGMQLDAAFRYTID